MVKAMKLFAFLAFSVFVATQPVAAASTPELVPLEQQLAALVSAQPTELGIAAYDLNSNSSICVNCEAAFPMASTVKIAVAAAYLSQVDFGRRSLDDRIGSQMAAHSVGPDDHQGTDGIERLPPHLDAAPCRSALARPSLRPLCCLWARSFVLPIAVERRNHFAVAGEHALIAPPWRVL